MTDVIRPANGQAANAQSSGNAWQDLHGTPGFDAAIRERNLVAPESGEARAWPKRPGPGAASPAGWFLPTDGEAAPPFRSGMEPARSDEIARAPGADGEDRGGWRQNPQPASAYPARALWPWTFPTGSRPVPVVGPTEALRGRGSGPGTAVPSGAVPGVPAPARRSSWQLAQEVWQESGVAWEPAAPELADVEPAAGWLPDGEPAGVARLAYAPPDTDLPDLGPARFQPAAAGAWPGYADLADGDREDPESADYERTTAEAWPDGPQPGDYELDARERADFERAPGDGWLGGREPHDLKRSAPDAWAAGRPADDTEFGATDPDGFEPVADEEFGDPAGAETWFTGVGPADSRFVDARSAGPSPADAQRDNQRRPGSPGHPGRVGPGQGWRAPRPGPAWNEYSPDGFPGQAWPAGAGRVPLGAPVALDPQAPESVSLTEPFSAAELDDGAPGWAGGTSFSEPDELFRAWQGSVNQAAAARGPWSVPRRAAAASRRRRALHAAAIGVPVVVIVTVGAGALMMLTGKANDMLAVRADTGAASPAATATGTSGTQAAARPTGGRVPSAFVGAALSGYPGQRGTVTVASLMAAAGVTLAVGAADGHPAIWRRAAAGSWTLESAASLSAVAGSAGLASVADGPAGWIAVGTTSDGRSTEPVVFASADGVRWQPVTSLAAQAGTGTEFLGAAAGRSGYVVVGRQMISGRTFAVLWHSAELRSWTSDDNDGLDGRLAASTANAVTATAGGFVAVGSHGADQAMWVSSDGQHWRLDSASPPAGAASATLSSVVASGATVAAGGYAATRAGDIPVVVVSADGGGQWRQVVLQAPDGLGVITALTATPEGFTAAGVVGRSGSQHAVTWTSSDALAWSSPTQVAGTEITALTLAGSTVVGTAEQGATATLVALPAP
jgi:hypothetical protein